MIIRTPSLTYAFRKVVQRPASRRCPCGPVGALPTGTATAPSRSSLCRVLLLSPSATSFFLRWSDHADPRDVAAFFDLPLRTVQRLFARFDRLGSAGIAPGYAACGQQQSRPTPADQVELFCQTRRDHPDWGSEMIRLEVEDQLDSLPCARTIRRHLRQANLQPAPAGRPTAASPRPRIPRATQPHEGWQIDASEELKLQNGRRVCWLRVVDECTGAFLRTVVFPQARWEHVARHVVQESLRDCFCRWGLPQRIRVDNGYPWGSSGDFPPELALWLIGLGIEMVWIQPGCPQQNGVVERAQQTGQDWFEPHTCRDPDELQRRCDALDRRQRERYPYQDGQSRAEVYPDLKHSGRKYSQRQEARRWDVRLAWAAVAQAVGKRRVDRTGTVSVYNRNRYVGKAYIGTEVYVTLDPTGPTWVIADDQGRQLRTHGAEELAAERIRSLNVAGRKGKRRR
jgi:transposase InsO family protein